MEDKIKCIISKQLLESLNNLQVIASNNEFLELIGKVALICVGALQSGSKILFAGNGGSAADSQHLAGELVSRFNYDRPGLPAFALTTDTSVLTAIGNDYGYEQLFARQIEAVGNSGDVFIGISTSGNSPNILKALETARNKGMITVGLTGKSGGQMRDICAYCLHVPSDFTPRIQEGHILIGHIICCIIEQQMFPKD